LQHRGSRLRSIAAPRVFPRRQEAPMTRRPILALATTLAVAALAACQDEASGPEPPGTPQFSADVAEESAAEQLSRYLEETNAALAAAGADFRARKAEYITYAGSQEAGAEVLAQDVGNKHLVDDFVPFDERRTW